MKSDEEELQAGSSSQPEHSPTRAGGLGWPMLQKRALGLLTRVSRGRSLLVFSDQIMVSGSNFLASIVLVRGLGLSEFGKYSIAYILLLYANALQLSFVGSPMLSLAPLLPDKEKRQFVNGMLAVQILSSLLLFTVFASVGMASRIFTDFYSVPCIFAFAFTVGTFQLQDWLRRYYFLYSKGRLAIVSDFISYTVQLIVLVVFWRLGILTLFRTFLIMCITSVAAIVMGPITDPIRPAMRRLRETWAHCRGLSRDLLVSSQVQWLGVQGVQLVGTAIVGTTEAGGLRATLNLTGPANLAINSIENLVPIRIAEGLKRTGTAGAYAFTKKAMLAATSSLTLLILPVAIFGRPILRFLYGPAMVAFYLPMLLQLIRVVVQIVSRMWFFFYRGVQDARALFRAQLFGTLTAVGTVYVFGHLWRAPGIVLASLLGEVAVLAYYTFHWTRNKRELLLKYPAALSNVAMPESRMESEPAFPERDAAEATLD